MTTAMNNTKRTLTVVLLALALFTSLSVSTASTAEARSVKAGVTYTKVTMECFNGGIRVNTQLTHKYSDSQMENWVANYRLYVYKKNTRTGAWEYYGRTKWLAGYGGLNYSSGKTFTKFLNLPAGKFTVGVQAAVLNPHNGEWLWDKYLTFGTGKSTIQHYCRVEY